MIMVDFRATIEPVDTTRKNFKVVNVTATKQHCAQHLFLEGQQAVPGEPVEPISEHVLCLSGYSGEKKMESFRPIFLLKVLLPLLHLNTNKDEESYLIL